MKNFTVLLASSLLAVVASAGELEDSVKTDYDEHLGALWDHFHRNPELSFQETKTATQLGAVNKFYSLFFIKN